MSNQDDNVLQLQGVYNTLYNALTRPDYKFVVTRYFIDEWVPVLGPSLAWLIVGLRQRCYQNNQRDWCIVDKITLSEKTGLSERTIERQLKKPYSHWFMLGKKYRYRYRSELGKTVRDKNRYHLLLDEPLSPRHQLGLAEFLRGVAPLNPDSLAAAIDALEIALDEDHLTDKISSDEKIPKKLDRKSIFEIVLDEFGLELMQHANDKRLPKLEELCSKLHNVITQPNKIHVGWQYFRNEWVPILGPALAWLVIYMRRNCFWDASTGELRDECHLAKKEMAAAIGQTPRNLNNLLDSEYASLFFAPTEPTDPNSRPRALTFRVRLVDEPLTPRDRARLAHRFRQQLEGLPYAIDPETGQMNIFPIFDRLSNRQDFTHGQIQEDLAVRSSISGKFGAEGGNFVGKNGNYDATVFKDSNDSINDSKTDLYQTEIATAELDIARQQWQATLDQLQYQMARATFDTWLRHTSLLERDEDTFVVSVQNQYAVDWLEHRLRETIERTLRSVVGAPVDVAFVLLE